MGRKIDTGAILTTAANDMVGNIHDRMPVVIRQEDFSTWLNCREVEPKEVQHLLQPAGPDLFEAIPVSTLVNKVANTGPELQQLAAAEENYSMPGWQQICEAWRRPDVADLNFHD